ncbi:MAG: hypothetical protein ABH858_00540 [Candidatus Omnitrophota bacterium]
MEFKKWGHEFDGGYTSPDTLQEVAGVYVVLCSGAYVSTVVDVGEAENVKKALLNHPRSSQWKDNCYGTLYYAAHYTFSASKRDREVIESLIREIAHPPCG